MLPSTVSLINKYNLAPKKSLGQNFITDKSLTDKIVKAAGDLKGKIVVEIGPGPACLTRSILDSGVKKLYVVEKDENLIPLLQEVSTAYDDKLEIISADALLFDESSIATEKDKIIIISNLPYNISTVLLLKWLKLDIVESMTLMFQKEVADRIAAKPHNKIYGRLSVMAQALADVKYNFTVMPTAFFPPPKVKSAIVSFVSNKDNLNGANLTKLEALCKAAFAQRRKVIRTSMKPMNSEISEVLAKLEIDSGLRAENLTVQDFCNITKLL